MSDSAITPLFTTAELMRLQGIVRHHVVAAAAAPLMMIAALLALGGVGAVGFVEYEIVYRVFDYLAGDLDENWSPALMACSSGIVIVGFHLLAQARPDNPAVRFVDRIVGVLIPVYLLGVGLLIAAMLYANGLGELVAPQDVLMFGDAPASEGDGQWIKQLFADFTTPLAVLAFSLGIGGLAICNIFVSHRLLCLFEGNLREAGNRLRQARAALSDYARIKHAQRRHAELGAALAELDRRWTPGAIREAITGEVLNIIADGLQPHKSWLRERELHPAARFEQNDEIDVSQVAASIGRIEAITWQQVWAALHPQHLENAS